MSSPMIRVIKVGGSLFELPEIRQRLADWLAAQSPATCVFVAGGGKVVQSIRELDTLHRLGEAASHWLCIRAMSVTARLLVDLLDDAALVDELRGLHELFESRPSRAAVFDVTRFMTGEEPSLSGVVLPQDWSVTSDSIAARLAQVVGAAELVLLKSELPASGRLDEMAAAGYIDGFFPTIAVELPEVRFVNLRDEAFTERTLTK